MKQAGELAKGLGVVAWVAALVHLLGPDSHPALVVVHASSGAWWIAGVALTALALVSRDRVAIGITASATLASVLWLLVGAAPDPGPQEGRRLRVGVANVLSSNPQAVDAVVDLVAAGADVLAVLELTAKVDQQLGTLADPAVWPDRTTAPRSDNFGIGLYASKATNPQVISASGMPWITADVHGVEVIVAHTLPPLSAGHLVVWAEQLTWLADRNRDGRPRIVLGDLNLTRHNPSFRLLTRSGYTDALARAGRAAARTWTPLMAGPDLARLDYILVSRNIGVASAEVRPRHGSDHRGLFAELILP